MAMVTRKIRHKNGDGSIVEAEIGAKAENVLEDENHRFATDAEKTSWNGKVDSDGGDIANTKVSEFAASSAQWPVPAAGESPETLWGKVKKFIEDFKNWMAGVCLIGQIVNDCVTNNANLPLSAAQGKVLMDLYTVLNDDFAPLDEYRSIRPYFPTSDCHRGIPAFDQATSSSISYSCHSRTDCNSFGE